MEETINVDSEIKKILDTTPFNSYDDLFSAINSGKASIKLSNSACRQISQIEKPLYSNLGLFLGFIPSIFFTIWYSVNTGNFWTLFLILLELLLPYIVYLCLGFNLKVHYLSYIVFLANFFIKVPVFLNLLAFILLFSYWGVTFWEKSLYVRAIKILRYKQDAFLWGYSSNNLAIADCFGNLYYKAKLHNSNDTTSTVDSKDVIYELMNKSGMSEQICTDIYTILTYYTENQKDIAENHIQTKLIPHLKEEMDITNVGLAFGMLIDDIALSKEDAQRYSEEVIIEIVGNE